VSLDCLRPVSWVLNVSSVSGLSSSCVLGAQCFQCLWIVFVLCLGCSMAPKTLDEDNPETLETLSTQDTGRRQSRDTGNIEHPRHWTKTIQRHWKIVFVQCLGCSMFPVSLDCLRPVSWVLNVSSVSGLSSSCVLGAQCFQCLWIVFVQCLGCSIQRHWKH
jgi:hypothetical protein